MIIFKAALKLISLNINSYFQSIQDHLDNSISQLNDNIQKIEIEFSKIAKEFPDNDYEIAEEYQDVMGYYKEIYPETVYNSTFLITYSFFEKTLKKIRDDVERFIIQRNGNICNIGSYAEKHRNTIANLTGITSIGDDTALWDKINGIYRNLRNSIAHDNNCLYDENNTLLSKNAQTYNFIKNNSDFFFDNRKGEFRIVNSHFLETLIEELKKYLQIIVKELNTNSNTNFR